MKKYGLIVVLFIVAIVLVYLFSSNQDYVKTGGLYISEIVSSNSYTYKNKNGDYADYIELYNDYNYDIDLSGYRLTDSIVDANKWIFPSITIKSHEYMLIYADKKDTCIDECHTNFKLNKDGEVISLIDNTGNIISKVRYPKLSSDVSYSFVNKKYIITEPSPGMENSDIEIKDIDISKYQIKINEYMTHNKSASYASNGGYYDFVEIYNESDTDLNLKGLFLSDEKQSLNKFIFPDIIIKAHDYLVVYLSGGEEIPDAIYASFKLSDNDEQIILSANGKIIDAVDIVKLDKNMSYGLKNGKWLYFMSPTPGYENTTYGVESWGT